MDSYSFEKKYVFGPVPSRRLGRSLGVDLVPFKTCTFDCIYCDLGRTTHKTIFRQPYVSPEGIRDEVELTLCHLERKPDYITLSGSGEATLNNQVNEIIRKIKEITSIPLAVLTNGSLLFLDEVRKDLLEADLVLQSLNAVTPALFGYIHRPASSLGIEEIISGLVQFRQQYRGQIWLEIFFCLGVNDGGAEVEGLKEAIGRIQPDRIQLNTVVRPTAEDFVFPLTPEKLEEIRITLGEKAEVISEVAPPLGDRFEVIKDSEIINLVRRRPCTAEDVSGGLGLHLGEATKHLAHLSQQGLIRYRMFQHRCYFEIASNR